MRGQDAQQGRVWSYIQPEQRVPQTIPSAQSGPWWTRP
jgi:hypothetical protein